MSVNDLIAEGVSLFKSNNFAQAIVKFNQAWSEIKDKNSQIEEQNYIQWGLGRCCLEQAMKAKNTADAMRLFTQAIAHYRQQFELARQLEGKQASLQGQNNAQFWLGYCYFEQAMKAKDAVDATRLLTQAIVHYQQQLELARQLEDKQVGLQEQSNAQSGLGRCYFEQAMKAKDAADAAPLFTQAIAHCQQQLELARQLEDKQAGLQEQSNVRSELGRYYFAQAMKAKDAADAAPLFTQAIAHYQQQLELARQLEGKQASIQEQNDAQFGLGRCYFEQAIKVKDITEAKDLFAQATAHFQQQLKLAGQLEDKQASIQEQSNAQFGLGCCYLEQAIKAKDAEYVTRLFTQAIAHYQQRLELAKQLEDKQIGLQEQSNMQFWLGRCYFEQAMKAKDAVDAAHLFTLAITHCQQRIELASQLEDKQADLQEQSNMQFWLGRYYFEQAMKAKDTEYATRLFTQAIAHYQQQLELVRQLEDKQVGLQEQSNAQSGLGRCYFEQAMKAKDAADAAPLFTQAIAHCQQQLELARQLKGKQACLQAQSNAQSGLGRCYFEQAMKAKDAVDATCLFTQAIVHCQRRLELARQLEDKQADLQEQSNVQSEIGRYYFEQAMKAKDAEYATHLFTQAIAHYQQRLELARQLEYKQVGLQEQSNAQSWLGLCYFEQAMKAKDAVDATHLFTQAIAHYQEQLKLARWLNNKQVSLQNQIYAQYGIGLCYFSQGIKIKNSSQNEDTLQNEAKVLFKEAMDCFLCSLRLLPQFDDEQERYRIKKRICDHLRGMYFLRSKWNLYFNKKKQEIHEILFSNENNSLDEKLKETISTVLAVLHIPPIELGSTPLAHYTSSTVCNKLFGVVNEDDPTPMRIGSSSYMNDPSEGKGLLELLALQDLELENKVDCSSHNAFFACFSARVNDLNQFRLYGKEDGVEASGCCLIFNKNGNWLREPDISAPYRSFIKNQGENSAEFKEYDISNVECENLPLYQVAYIAYKDEYIAEEKCKIWLGKSEFGVRLKPVGKNSKWHKFRIKKLEKALEQLMDFFNGKANDKNKNALEYIRYLFKDFAFRDEEEFRVLKIAEIGSEEIKYCETTKSIYLPYADISNVVDEVILGTNYEKTNSRRKAEVFQHQMRQKCPNVKVSRSSLPIYANPPIKKD